MADPSRKILSKRSMQMDLSVSETIGKREGINLDALEPTGSDGIYSRSLDEFKIAQRREAQT